MGCALPGTARNCRDGARQSPALNATKSTCPALGPATYARRVHDRDDARQKRIASMQMHAASSTLAKHLTFAQPGVVHDLSLLCAEPAPLQTVTAELGGLRGDATTSSKKLIGRRASAHLRYTYRSRRRGRGCIGPFCQSSGHQSTRYSLLVANNNATHPRH